MQKSRSQSHNGKNKKICYSKILILDIKVPSILYSLIGLWLLHISPMCIPFSYSYVDSYLVPQTLQHDDMTAIKNQVNVFIARRTVVLLNILSHKNSFITNTYWVLYQNMFLDNVFFLLIFSTS